MTKLDSAPRFTLGLRQRRSRLLVSCALASALAVAGPSSRASAQAFQGTPTFDPAKVDINRTVPGTDTITVKVPQAIINWTPTDNAIGGGGINFLPQGNTGIFQNDGTTTANFAVLNRIIPADTSRRIEFNGTVISQLRDASNNVTGRGGTVAFYSPGGIFISSTAVFDVGSLLLTTLDPVVDGSGNFMNPTTGLVQLRGVADSTSSVTTAAGSQINTRTDITYPEGSFIAMVAPVVDHAGAVRVNGSAAYVAGESVDLRVNDGLFDITVNTGTSVANPLTHSGSTGGPAQGGGTDNHGIYMVAVPKNQAITMLLSGSVGFDAAASASVENGQIVLSAGRNILAGQINPDSPRGSNLPVNDTVADIVILSGNFTSDVVARATTGAFAASSVGTPTFQQDLTLQGGVRAHIAARRAGETLSIGGNAAVITDDRPSSGPGRNTLGGESLVYADNGGTLQIAGNTLVRSIAGARPGDTAFTATGGTARIFAANGSSITMGAAQVIANAQTLEPVSGTQISVAGTGGTASIFAGDNSTITMGAALVSADGFGQANGGNGNGVSGAGFGGTAVVDTNTGGQITINGALTASANGSGGIMNQGSTAGGEGRGGSALIGVDGGQVNVTGTATLTGRGTGGYGDAAATDNGTGGVGRGGTARITTTDPAGTITVGGSSMLFASGFGGVGKGTGGSGDGFGGLAEAVVTAGTLNSALFLQASGRGGGFSGGTFNALSDTTAVQARGTGGGNGTGGTAAIFVASGGTLATGTAVLPVFGTSTASPNAIAIARGFGGGSFNGAQGGNGEGGTASIGTDGGTITVGLAIQIGAEASGGNSTISGMARNGGGAIGGTATLFASNGGAITSRNSAAGVRANATGGSGIGGGDGGDATAGSAAIFADAGTIRINDDDLSFLSDITAIATGGAGARGGAAMGGNSSISAINGGSITAPNGAVTDPLFGIVRVRSEATGGSGTVAGGNATGGFAGLSTDGNSTITFRAAELSSRGTGGNGAAGTAATPMSRRWVRAA
jgi:hypothetical protein